jgi:hypothetical protein
MIRLLAISTGVLAAGLAASGLWSLDAANGAAESGSLQHFAEVRPTAVLAGAADVRLRFIQEDGPRSGHVRVVLAPETRPLTILEARSAARQAFLHALSEKGLGDDLRRITVVVRLMPESHPGSAADEQVFRFMYKGGKDWSIFAGE